MWQGMQKNNSLFADLGFCDLKYLVAVQKQIRFCFCKFWQSN